MAKLLKLRRGTTSQHGSFTGAEGEVTVDTDKETLVVHDGSTAGGHAVAAEDMANVSSANIVGRLGTGSVVKAKLEADIIDSTKLADDAVNSEHYVDGSIDTAHIADAQITHVKLSNDCIDGDNIQDDVVNSEHIAAGAVDLEHMSAESVDEDNLKISNSGSNGQYLQKQSGNAGGLTWAAVDLSPYAPLASPTFTGTANGANLTLSGNLTVNGTTTTVATTNTTLTDNLLELNSGASSNANDSGILIERGSTGDNAIIAWDESADKFTVGTTTGTASSTGNISITTGTLVANVEGNVTGNTSGSSGSCTGNAATATTATNVVAVSNASNTAYRVPFLSANTGTAAVYTDTDSGMTYNPSTNTLTSAAFSGNLTGNITGNADTVDNLHASNFLRSDANDSFTSGTLTITSSTDYPLTFNNSSDAKIDLKGANSPYIRFREGTTEKAYIQWSTSGHFQFVNQEDSSRLRIKDAIDFTADGTNYYNVIHAGNVGSSGSLSSVTVYTSAVHDSKGPLRRIVQAYKSSAHTLVVGDAGKCIQITTGGVTVNPSIFTEGDAVTIVNHSGSDQTITQGSSFTLYNTADGSTGNRTLAGRGMATMWFANHNVAYISGAGLS